MQRGKLNETKKRKTGANRQQNSKDKLRKVGIKGEI
jgi:hypothetical protein